MWAKIAMMITATIAQPILSLPPDERHLSQSQTALEFFFSSTASARFKSFSSRVSNAPHCSHRSFTSGIAFSFQEFASSWISILKRLCGWTLFYYYRRVLSADASNISERESRRAYQKNKHKNCCRFFVFFKPGLHIHMMAICDTNSMIPIY